jgi:hypothetical protein
MPVCAVAADADADAAAAADANRLQVVKAMMVFWTAGFVLLTLLINAPMLPLVLRLTGLSKVCCLETASHSCNTC